MTSRLRRRILACVVVASVVSSMASAGVYRNDFQVEQDYVDDIEAGVWGGTPGHFKWKDGAIGIENLGPLNWPTILIGDNTWEDYTISCRLMPLKLGSLGIVARDQYWFCLEPGRAAIYRDFLVFLGEDDFEAEADIWYDIEVVVKGDNLDLYVDGELTAEADDRVSATGQVGFIVWSVAAGGIGAVFDDLVIEGETIPDGGHWDSAAHGDLPVDLDGRLTTTWSRLRQPE